MQINYILSSTRVTIYAECINVLTEYMKYLSIRRIVIFFDKMWMALKRAVRAVWWHCARNFFNSLLTSRFVQFFSENLSVNLFAVYLFKYKLFFIKIFSSSLNTMLIVEEHCTNVCSDELIAKVMQSVWGKTRYFKYRICQNLKQCSSFT